MDVEIWVSMNLSADVGSDNAWILRKSGWAQPRAQLKDDTKLGHLKQIKQGV